MIRLLLASYLALAACGGSSKPTTTAGTVPAGSPDNVTITMQADGTDQSFEGEFILAPDGTFTANATAIKDGNRDTKTKIGKLSATNELVDDHGTSLAKLADDGTVSVLNESVTKQNGKVMKSESTWNVIGTIDAAGELTVNKDGGKITIGDDGTVNGIGPGMRFTIHGKPERRRVAMMIVVAMLAGGKTTVDSSAATADPTLAPSH